MSERRQSDGFGCALFVFLLVVGAVIAAAVSLAAVADPFAWMPPLADVWADCDDDYGTDVDECALSKRYDGFWWHTAVNLGYTVITALFLLGFALAVAEFREARRERFADATAEERYADAIDELVGATVLIAIFAAIPIVVTSL